MVQHATAVGKKNLKIAPDKNLNTAACVSHNAGSNKD